MALLGSLFCANSFIPYAFIAGKSAVGICTAEILVPPENVANVTRQMSNISLYQIRRS